MVNLVIMRHGEAEPQYLSDSERQLTAAGQAEVSEMAQWLHHHYSAFDRIFSSPYRRTQQTAAVLLQKGLSAHSVEVNADLVPEGNAQLVVDFLDMLYAENPQAKILLVSHMPLVSFLVEAFTRSGQTPIFDTAGVACIEYHPAQGHAIGICLPGLLQLGKIGVLVGVLSNTSKRTIPAPFCGGRMKSPHIWVLHQPIWYSFCQNTQTFAMHHTSAVKVLLLTVRQ